MKIGTVELGKWGRWRLENEDGGAWKMETDGGAWKIGTVKPGRFSTVELGKWRRWSLENGIGRAWI